MVEKLIVINPRGFCAGVEMAIKALTWMVKLFPSPIYCYHDIVHNDWIVEVFKKNGVVFVETPDDIPLGSVAMLSAHGTSPSIKQEFNNNSSILIDSVCPLVTKVHHEAKNLANRNTQIIYIGHKGHDEATGALGVAPEKMILIEKPEDLLNFKPDDPTNVALLAQTTLAISEWKNILEKSKKLYPEITIPRKSDLCYATTNRQEAVIQIAHKVATIIVVGSTTSSNTNALVNTVMNLNANVLRVNNVDELDDVSALGESVAITAGASAPDHIVEQIINKISPNTITHFTNIEEEEYFPLPIELRKLHRNISAILYHIFPKSSSTNVKSHKSSDRDWTATDALGELN